MDKVMNQVTDLCQSPTLQEVWSYRVLRCQSQAWKLPARVPCLSPLPVQMLQINGKWYGSQMYKEPRVKLTLQLVPYEVTVKLRLRDQELELPSLSRRLSLFLLCFGFLQRFLFSPFTVNSFLTIILLPKEEHFSSKTTRFGLDVFDILSCASRNPLGLD